MISITVEAAPPEAPQVSEEVRMWRVYVALPLAPRQRKQTVRIYRVGATTAEKAKARVHEEIIGRQEHKGCLILSASNFCAVDSVIYDGMTTYTPDEVTALAGKGALK